MKGECPGIVEDEPETCEDREVSEVPMEINEEVEYISEEDDQAGMAGSSDAETEVENSESDEVEKENTGDVDNQGDEDSESDEGSERDEGEDSEDDESDEGASALSYVDIRLLRLKIHLGDPMSAPDDILGNYINELDAEGQQWLAGA